MIPDPPALSSLPHAHDGEGQSRLVGIEVEFGGLTEARVAELAVAALGGTASRTGPFEWQIAESRIGRIRIVLDTALRTVLTGDLGRAGLDLGRAVIPVEIITDPIQPAQIAVVDRLCTRLAEAGAMGTTQGFVLGFGTHLNVTLAGHEVDDILPTLRAYALSEDWLRARDPVNPARRLLPFVDPYPMALLDRLALPSSGEWDLDDLVSVYLDTAPSRNHGLDMLPVLEFLTPDRLTPRLSPRHSVRGRPAFHYRLPDCRIDAPDWSVAREWNRWCRIERIAADADLVEDLAHAWRLYRDRFFPMPGRWADISTDIIEDRLDLPPPPVGEPAA